MKTSVKERVQSTIKIYQATIENLNEQIDRAVKSESYAVAFRLRVKRNTLEEVVTDLNENIK